MPFAKLTLLTEAADGRHVKLMEPLVFIRPNGEVITAPIGTLSDGASTPPVIWPVIPPFGSYWLATVLHDYLYRITKRDKDECDLILLEAMVSLEVPLLLREAIYEGVHLGGGIAFDDDRRVALKAYRAFLAVNPFGVVADK